MLHMDINKTVLMTDSVCKKSATTIVNEVLSDVAWGSEVDGRWVLSVAEPSVKRPPPKERHTEDGNGEILSYAEWLESVLPGSSNRREREARTGRFTSDGEPGAALNRYRGRLMSSLCRPDGSPVQIIPSFFQLLLFLKHSKRSFTLCFRTFGEDLQRVLDELNSFCEGRHPSFPEVCMDGSDGEADYRFHASNAEQYGTFHRDDDCTSLVLGTWEQPGEGRYREVTDRSLSFYSSSRLGGRTICGIGSVCDFMEDSLSRPGTVALRDHFLFWKSKGFSSAGGKVFFVQRPSPLASVHHVFFDDNIRFCDAHIVQLLDRNDLETSIWAGSVLHSHLCKAVPWESIPDHDYFIKHVQRLEDGFDRSMRARERCRKVLWKIRLSRSVVGRIMEKCPTTMSPHDPWKGLRLTDRDVSVATHGEFEERCDHELDGEEDGQATRPLQ